MVRFRTMATQLKGDAAVAPAGDGAWREIVARYQRTEVPRAFVELVVTLGPLAGLFALMVWSLDVSYWLTLLIAIPAAGFLVRTFIIMHDCAHNSFLPWRFVNDSIGAFTGYLTLTPFHQWRRDHAIHHASSGDLDRRGHGDVDTITVREYLALSPRGKFQYRMKRHPVALLLVGPLWLMYSQRFRPRSKATKDKQISSVIWTNIAIVSTLALAAVTGTLAELLLVYFPVIYISGSAGVFLFYVQHQYEETYWEEHKNWDYATASIAGSSYLKLPAPLMWITGNIGLHHVHHLGPKIPNYRLQQAHDENPFFHNVTILTLKDTGRALTLALWDEEKEKLVSFKDLERREIAA
jgi:omega-6 fatty acid desaturase (delta-12 desaturase)